MTDMTAYEVKKKALELGAHLVGIASAKTINENFPPPESHARPLSLAEKSSPSPQTVRQDNPMLRTRISQTRPQNLEPILHGAKSVIVLALRLLWAMSRLKRWNSREAHYTGELILTHAEEIGIELVWFLEGKGYPSIVIPASYSRALQIDQLNEGPVSLPHLAVEAGLGTLGLNGMLLTPEYGPRVVLGAVVTAAELEADRRIETALCLGESCGRCLLACPGDAIGHWEMDVEKCRPYSSPYGYHFVREHARRVLEEQDPHQKMEIVRSTDTFMIWQSMLRGVGVLTGCTRCADVCPVGADYQEHLEEVEEGIPESTPEKEEKLHQIRLKATSGESIDQYEKDKRWIGALQNK
ncbi:MAG: epoxyqueuosine reductase [Acidobacteria bacterium]|nr:epoxyqueuosine reductase [Acidobacteriota bacterium]